MTKAEGWRKSYQEEAAHVKTLTAIVKRLLGAGDAVSHAWGPSIFRDDWDKVAAEAREAVK
jgi:hypothetical protein